MKNVDLVRLGCIIRYRSQKTVAPDKKQKGVQSSFIAVSQLHSPLKSFTGLDCKLDKYLFVGIKRKEYIYTRFEII